MVKLIYDKDTNRMEVGAQGGAMELLAELCTASNEFLNKLSSDAVCFELYKTMFLSAMEKFAVFEEKEEK